MPKTREYQTLLDASQQEGCSLCRMTEESIHRYLGAWQYELFTDVDVRKELRLSQGFCHTHTWLLVRMGATLPLAQAYRDIISDMMHQLQNENSDTTKGLFHHLFGTKHKPLDCPACHHKMQAEIRYIHTLRHALLNDAFFTQFAASDGLCLDHFRLACELKMPDTPGEWLSLLRKAQLACLQHLDRQLGELIRKHDYRFRDEVRGSEVVAWKRAAGLIAGEEHRT